LEKENQKLVNEWKSIITGDDILNKNIKTNTNTIEILSKDAYLSYYSQYIDNLSIQIIKKIQTNEIKAAIQYYKAMENLSLKVIYIFLYILYKFLLKEINDIHVFINLFIILIYI